MIVDELMDAGIVGCCINIGGDLRVAGRSPTPELDGDARLSGIIRGQSDHRWRGCGVHVDHHEAPMANDGRRRTPPPRRCDRCQARDGPDIRVVIAATAQQAEVLAKVAIAAGPHKAADVLAANKVTGVVVDDSGAIDELPGFDGFRLQGCVRDATQPGEATSADTIGDGAPAGATTERVTPC